MRPLELLLPLRGAEDVPSLDCDPVDAGHVGCGEDAFDFEEFGVALGPGGVGDDLPVLVLVEVHEREHLAADGFVTYPEDEVRSPLHGLDGVREGEEEGADAFGVHGASIWLRVAQRRRRQAGLPSVRSTYFENIADIPYRGRLRRHLWGEFYLSKKSRQD